YMNFSALSPQVSCANAGGYAVFQGNLALSAVTVPPVTSANNGGVFRRDPSGAVSLMLRKGDLTPAGEQLDGLLPSISPMNASGSFAVNVG
ncbi:hypothetical protein, partial [Salmonella sp. SAL4448]|uniref:hypothetical protein n=1 Tax=Salmonella sp. SAL4448 TaxID=3159903 RepID=UPI0039786AF0